MSDSVSREVVEAFYEAYAVRDAAKVAPFLHEDVEWTISGPVDLLPFCGTRRGRTAVVDLIGGVVPTVIRVFNFTTEALLVDGNRVASLNRLGGRHAGDGRVISYRVAHFMRFEESKVIENFSFIDSFDAVEQVLGHALAPHDVQPEFESDLIVV
jgi:ketosteroid isomerase-like protein